MRIALVFALAACAVPSSDSCPSGEQRCGIDGPCFDPATGTCCGPLLSGGEICGVYQTCAPTSPDSFNGSCQSDAWSLVVCVPGTTSSTYRGSYKLQSPNEALVGNMPAHEYELQFEDGCAAIQAGAFAGNSTVTFDGVAHTASWTAMATDGGPLTFSGDPTLGLTTIVVRSWDGTGFHGDVTDMNGTHAVAFTLVQ